MLTSIGDVPPPIGGVNNSLLVDYALIVNAVIADAVVIHPHYESVHYRTLSADIPNLVSNWVKIRMPGSFRSGEMKPDICPGA